MSGGVALLALAALAAGAKRGSAGGDTRAADPLPGTFNADCQQALEDRGIPPEVAAASCGDEDAKSRENPAVCALSDAAKPYLKAALKEIDDEFKKLKRWADESGMPDYLAKQWAALKSSDVVKKAQRKLGEALEKAGAAELAKQGIAFRDAAEQNAVVKAVVEGGKSLIKIAMEEYEEHGWLGGTIALFVDLAAYRHITDALARIYEDGLGLPPELDPFRYAARGADWLGDKAAEVPDAVGEFIDDQLDTAKELAGKAEEVPDRVGEFIDDQVDNVRGLYNGFKGLVP